MVIYGNGHGHFRQYTDDMYIYLVHINDQHFDNNIYRNSSWLVLVMHANYISLYKQILYISNTNF